jgi:hypothetical protein
VFQALCWQEFYPTTKLIKALNIIIANITNNNNSKILSVSNQHLRKAKFGTTVSDWLCIKIQRTVWTPVLHIYRHTCCTFWLSQHLLDTGQATAHCTAHRLTASHISTDSGQPTAHCTAHGLTASHISTDGKYHI